MTLLLPFIGSPQSRYAATAIVVAIIFVSIAILLGSDAMPLSQKFFFVMLISLLSVPGILLSLLQLTCLVTGAGNENKRWWCSLYSWVMSAFVIVYSIIIIIVAIQTLTNKEKFSIQAMKRTGANNFMVDYPAQYPPDYTPAPQEYPTLATTESGLPTDYADSDKNQYMVRRPVNEEFLGMPDNTAEIENFATDPAQL